MSSMDIPRMLDDAINHAETAKRAALEFDSDTACKEYRNAVILMKHIIRSGAIKDPNSLALLKTQCDNFSAQSKLHEQKLLEAKDNELQNRLKNLKKDVPRESEDELRARYKKMINAETPSEQDLIARVRSLGPATLPVTERDDEVEDFLEKVEREADSSIPRSDVEKQAHRVLGEVETNFKEMNIALDYDEDAEVSEIMKQAQEMNRFTGSTAPRQPAGAKSNDEKLLNDSSSEDDDDDSSYEDDSDEDRRKKSKHKKKKGKGKKRY